MYSAPPTADEESESEANGVEAETAEPTPADD